MENKKNWDYTKQAKFYSSRPNYSAEAINRLCNYVGANAQNYRIADIGAGTGNLTLLLKDKATEILAIEPTSAMREIGIERTKDFKNIKWLFGTGESIPLKDNSINFVTFGSSFNTTDREKALEESYRVLKYGGFFSCMWNNRDLTIPSQRKVEEIIKRYYSNYSHGTRREQQADVIIGSKLFNHLYYFERPQLVSMSLDSYISGWKSVKNNFWDLEKKEDMDIFEKITGEIKKEFEKEKRLELIYITKVWVAQKQETVQEGNIEKIFLD